MDWSTAAAELESAVAVLDQIPTERLGHNQLGLLALTLDRFCRTRIAQGRIDEAKVLSTRMAEVADRVPPSLFGRPPEVFQAMAVANRGRVAEAQGLGDESVALLRDAVERFRRLLVTIPKPSYHSAQSELYSTTNALVQSLDRQGRTTEGTATLEMIVCANPVLQEREPTVLTPEFASIQADLAERWLAAGRGPEARRLVEDALSQLAESSNDHALAQSAIRLKDLARRVRSGN